MIGAGRGALQRNLLVCLRPTMTVTGAATDILETLCLYDFAFPLSHTQGYVSYRHDAEPLPLFLLYISLPTNSSLRFSLLTTTNYYLALCFIFFNFYSTELSRFLCIYVFLILIRSFSITSRARETRLLAVRVHTLSHTGRDIPSGKGVSAAVAS